MEIDLRGTRRFPIPFSSNSHVHRLPQKRDSRGRKSFVFSCVILGKRQAEKTETPCHNILIANRTDSAVIT